MPTLPPRGARRCSVIAVVLLLLAAGIAQAAAVLPTGFQESIVVTGLTEPAAFQFAPDGRIFVAEKSGIIKVFPSLSSPTPEVFADLRTQVHNFWDRGLLGLALDPGFPARPYVYVLYTFDAPIGGVAPTWGSPNVSSDPCPTPPGATTDGCVVSARLSRLQAAGNAMVGAEQVLVEDWCQQYPSHSIGTLAFGPDGALYAGSGDGASFTFTDYGQGGNPRNPCGDPPVPVGGTQAPPTAEGGALRAQDLRTSGDPVGLSGAIIRIDPDTGAARADNPLAGHADANARRIVAHGLRNPFRFTFRPGTSELWIGDVGWDTWEEINVIPDPRTAVQNFGWPCYEGSDRQGGYSTANLALCQALYGQAGAATLPFFAYRHPDRVVAGESCGVGSSSISGLAFYAGGTYPPEYDGALFFADYARNCIWAMRNIPLGQPASGLVAAYGFEEGSGTTTLDASGNGNTGTLAGATWVAAGKTGRALRFDGATATVTIPDASSLDLTTGMTLMAWVNPEALGGWRTVAIKEAPGGAAYWLYADDDASRPAAYINMGGGDLGVAGTGALRLNTWTHLAATYDGSALRLYVNGALVRTLAVSGAIRTTAGALRLGGNAVWGEFFQGLLDDVRVYSRPLSATEIGADMNTAVPAGTSGGAPLSVTTFVAGAAGPVDLKIGPGGDLFYADLSGGTIRRIQYLGANRAPVAVVRATPTAGAAPLSVSFDGSGSSDPDAGDTLAFSWDLNGDGVFGDATTAQATFTYTTAGSHVVTLRVTDGGGAVGTANVTIGVGNAPSAVIDTPSAATTWRVGDRITFSGHATDSEDGTLPAAGLSWSLILHHCAADGSCHQHPLQDFVGVASGAFTAPDHEYPAHLELRLTARDSAGMRNTQSVLLQPQTATLSFQSTPSGLQLAVGSGGGATPFTRTAILNGIVSIGASSPQALQGTGYAWAAWSDGGAQSHNVTIAGAATLTATFAAVGGSACPCTLWPASAQPSVSAHATDPNAVELGVKFRASQAGTITAIRFYAGPGNTGPHTVNLWTTTGTLLARATGSAVTTTGWQQVNLPSPVAVQANTTYIASYHAPAGRYAVDVDYFTAETASGPLLAPASGAVGGNGVYAYGPTSAFPVETYRASNYWVDAVFTPGGSDTTSPTVVARTPAPGATGVSTTMTVTARFSEALDPATLTGTTFVLQGPAGPVPAAVSYAPATSTATLTPGNALTPGATYMARLAGGSTGVKDAAGNPLAADVTWTFTTAAASACPCTLWPPTAQPALESDPDPNAVELGVKFQAGQAGTITAIRFYAGPGNAGPHTVSLWSASGALLGRATGPTVTTTGWQQVSLPSPVAIQANTTYIASYFAPAGRYAFDVDYFAASETASGPLVAPASGAVGGNGVYAYGPASAFPSETYRASNYWVDVVFTPGP